MAAYRKIHLIFKTHLDVGFTDLAANVVRQYFERFIPQALQTARELREAGGPERFIWTTGSWLIDEYLARATPEQRAEMEAAIRAGDITWHALPVTTHSELLDVDLFRFGLSLSQGLDARFGKRTIAAKMTDVPGHTRGIVSLLAQAGVKFLHLGVNPSSRPPAVPPVFVWRAPDGAEVLVMYQKGSYGDLMEAPGLDEAIAFAHTNDNLGPQSADEIRHVFAEARQRFPGVEIVASTMDAFAERLWTVKDQLPVLTDEMGDTWIHGVGSDPLKVSQFRELARLLGEWRAAGILTEADPEYRACARQLLMVAEHTWGMDEKTYLPGCEAFSVNELKAIRAQPEVERFESSWAEQRAYVANAVKALSPERAREAQSRLDALTPVRPGVAGLSRVSAEGPFSLGDFDLRFDPNTGAIIHLFHRPTRRIWADAAHPLGQLYYESFSREDYARNYRMYNINKRQTSSWSIPDFTKPLMPVWAEHRLVAPELMGVYLDETGASPRIVCQLQVTGEMAENYGCPREFWLEYTLAPDGKALDCSAQWFHKSAVRLPEALWFSFTPRVRQPSRWRMDKLGQVVSPLEVIRDGNRKLHAVGRGVEYVDDGGRLALNSLDAPLVAPGERSLINFNNRQPALSHGMHYLLYDNQWGTNFRMWYDEDARFRFRIEVGA